MQTSSNNKWYLMICELHNPVIHGKTNTSDPHIETHYIVYNKFDPSTKFSLDYIEEDDYDHDDYDQDFTTIYDEINFLKDIYANPSNYINSYSTNHPTIRNYHAIVSSPNYIKPEIGEYIILPTQEAVAILKTFWLRIIQKKWKNVFKERKYIMKMRCNFSNLKIREICKTFPKSCLHLPGLKGMLSDLKQNK